MFRYYETYTVNIVRYFNEDILKYIVDEYKNYLEKRQYKDKKVWFGFAHNSDEIAVYLLGTKILRFKKTKPAK